MDLNKLNKIKRKLRVVETLSQFNKYIDEYYEKTDLYEKFEDFDFSESDFFNDTNGSRLVFIDRDYDYLDDICQELNDDWLVDARLTSEIMLNPKIYKKLGELIGNIFMSRIQADLYDEDAEDAVDMNTHLDYVTNKAGEYYAKEIIKRKWFKDVDEYLIDIINDKIQSLNESFIFQQFKKI